MRKFILLFLLLGSLSACGDSDKLKKLKAEQSILIKQQKELKEALEEQWQTHINMNLNKYGVDTTEWDCLLLDNGNLMLESITGDNIMWEIDSVDVELFKK